MWIMIGGPYSTGAKSAAGSRRQPAALNQAALAVFRKGHAPSSTQCFSHRIALPRRNTTS
jgi:hypothetical protein